jgi:hypothetical protein
MELELGIKREFSLPVRLLISLLLNVLRVLSKDEPTKRDHDFMDEIIVNLHHR